MSRLTLLAERFCAAPLPESVCSDPCATMPGYPHRTGTNLLTVVEAEQVLTHVLTQEPGKPTGYNGAGCYGASLSFEGGNLYVRIAGHGAFDGTGVIAFPGADLEMDEEGYYAVALPNSELIAIRDHLNEWFPPDAQASQ